MTDTPPPTNPGPTSPQQSLPTEAAAARDDVPRGANRQKQNVLILGATSAIARALARQLAAEGHNLILAARDVAEVERSAADLRVRHGIGAAGKRFDANAFDTHPAFFGECTKQFPGGLDGVILCHGSMPPQKDAETDFAAALETIHTNYASPVSILNLAANYFEPRRRGYICAVSSVAGDRGRQSNYIYGSAKGGLTRYLQGLRNRLTKTGVPVITVKPGFVDTGMTWGLLKPNSPIVATPDKVAADILRAIRKRKAEIYTPWFWWGIMGIIKSIPEPVFRRMKL